MNILICLRIHDECLNLGVLWNNRSEISRQVFEAWSLIEEASNIVAIKLLYLFDILHFVKFCTVMVTSTDSDQHISMGVNSVSLNTILTC